MKRKRGSIWPGQFAGDVGSCVDITDRGAGGDVSPETIAPHFVTLV
jgi:hypothetical protein